MPMKDSVRIFAPATVANVGCGFDIFGFAIDEPGDEVVLTKNHSNELRIVEITGDNGKLPYDIHENTAGVVIQKFLDDLELKQGIDIHLHKNMPLGSGLGSSAASSVAAIYAVNELMDNPLPIKELLPYAMEGERAACGSPHADNVAPSLFGGFVLIRSYDPLDVIEIPVPDDLFAAVIHPQIVVRTKDAREILRREILFNESVRQSGNIAGLVAGLLKSDFELIGRSLHDYIVEPVRSILIPGYDAVKDSMAKAGALGGSISGSGPSIFALCRGQKTAANVADAMQTEFSKLRIGSEVYVSAINTKGPRVIQSVLNEH